MTNFFDCLWQPQSQSETQPSKFQQELLSRKVVVYDCETVRCIPAGDRSPGLEYCRGWNDFKGMGIAVICAYSSWNDRYHVYLQDNLSDFQLLVDRAQEIVGFNSLSFDDQLCVANGLRVKTTYDLLCNIRVAAGMPPNYVKGATRAGYSLEQLAQANLGCGKFGTGVIAPELWQKGNRESVIDYCLTDVNITWKLYERRANLIDPTNKKVLMLT